MVAGALVFGVNRPDRAISISSLSGWYIIQPNISVNDLAINGPINGPIFPLMLGWIRYKREYYGDANPLFVMDLQLSHMSPQLKQLMESTIIEHDCGMLMR